MNLNIVTRSFPWFILGTSLIIGGIISAIVLPAWWPVVIALCGLLFCFRFEKNLVATKLKALQNRGAVIHGLEKEFFGRFNDHFVRGQLKLPDLERAEALLSPNDDQPAPPTVHSSPRASKYKAWLISEIDRIEFSSDDRKFTIITNQNSSIEKFSQTAVRDKVLSSIQTATPWRTEQQIRRIFKLNFWIALLCVPPMFFTCALAFTAVGVVQPNQLPLADWNALKNVRGKGAAIVLVWVLLCEAYRFLLANLPTAVAFILGVAASFALALAMYRAQWTNVTDTVWSKLSDDD